MNELGRYVEVDGRPAVRFERTYPHHVEAVWAAVTEADQLIKWFPSSVDLEPRAGGTVRFSGDPNLSDLTGTVLVFDPPRQVAFTWGPDEVHLQVEAVGDRSCRLTLTNVLSERNTAARNAAGWTVCLGELDNLMTGAVSAGPHSEHNQDRFGGLYAEHVALGLPAGAEIPGRPDLA